MPKAVSVPSLYVTWDIVCTSNNYMPTRGAFTSRDHRLVIRPRMRKPLFFSHDSGVAMHRPRSIGHTGGTRGRFKDPESTKKPCRQRLTISLLVHVTSKNTHNVQKCGVQPPSFASGHVHQRLCAASADQRSSLANVGSLKPQIVHQQKAKRNVDRLFFLAVFLSHPCVAETQSHFTATERRDRQK